MLPFVCGGIKRTQCSAEFVCRRDVDPLLLAQWIFLSEALGVPKKQLFAVLHVGIVAVRPQCISEILSVGLSEMLVPAGKLFPVSQCSV